MKILQHNVTLWLAVAELQHFLLAGAGCKLLKRSTSSPSHTATCSPPTPPLPSSFLSSSKALYHLHYTLHWPPPLHSEHFPSGCLVTHSWHLTLNCMCARPAFVVLPFVSAFLCESLLDIPPPLKKRSEVALDFAAWVLKRGKSGRTSWCQALMEARVELWAPWAKQRSCSTCVRKHL